MSRTYAAGYVLSFTDGGPDEETVLHIGTRQACEDLERTLLVGVAYSGERPGATARYVIVPYEEEVGGGDGG